MLPPPKIFYIQILYGVKVGQSLAQLHYGESYSWQGQTCGPEARAFGPKSIGEKRISSEDPPMLSKKEPALSGATESGMPEIPII
jgi:hypothetical protein